MASTQRLFIAVPIPNSLQAFFQEQQLAFISNAIRFVPDTNLHLTVHFLGEVPPDKVDKIISAVKKVAESYSAFNLDLECIEPGPKPKSPRLIWARFTAHPAFTELCQAVTTHLGIKPTNPDYIPHITLARFRKDMPKPIHLPILDFKTQHMSLPVNALALWQSEFKSPHPEYRILVMYPLKTADS
ncbi:RNA 2',3'-cyclic phosphodiesterase [Adhaeribacter swui]|uniref:RNA 2',3'-cyclic phosphodiesterase n=1 Tax=Adhaeribacter swui TaxID=2086471 RepID=A0A7G7G3Y0_9BACT|nr:RNA 2',3'-cyclic phosphodiesterase [Adhaeribacter swui]QNF31864.1 RNA 2',3'-cyclic phosphodiesterase [Adhaeribacter swui]